MVLAGTGYLRGLQDTRTPLVVAVVSAVANLVIEVVLIFGLGFDIGASAAATVVAQVGAAGWYVLVIRRSVRVHGAGLAPHWSTIGRLGIVGRDLFLRTVALRGALLLTTAAAARSGTAGLAAHQVSSIIYTGGGKVGSENGRSAVPFQISQRADFFETLTALQTTYRRPIVNSRDETLCGRQHYLSSSKEDAEGLARLHVIFYDASLSHAANVLKSGTMRIILAMLALRGGSLQAYAAPAGWMVLAFGAALCAVAYRVMVWIGRLPEEERVLR